MPYAPAEEFDTDDEFEGFSFRDEFDENKKEVQYINNIDENVKETSLVNILYEHVVRNQWIDVKKILKENATFNINCEIKSKWPLLFYAARQGQFEIVKYLIENGADPNIRCDLMTAMLAACSCATNTNSVLQIVQYLYDKQALVKVFDRFGVTPLMHASINGHFEVVNFLIKYSSIDARDNQQYTALLHAIENTHFEIAKLLIDNGAEKDGYNIHGSNGEELAVSHNFKGIETLFPTVDEYHAPNEYISYTNFKDLLPTYFKHVPPYIQDIDRLSVEIRCENLANNFLEANINLMEFLTMSNERLKELGIIYPFQRKLILLGIHKFHEYPWSPRTVKYIQLNESSSFYNYFDVCSSHLKHIIVGSTTIKYLNNFIHSKLRTTTLSYIDDMKRDLIDIRMYSNKAAQRIKYLEQFSTPAPALLITEKCIDMLNTTEKRLRINIYKYSIAFGICLVIGIKIRNLVS